MQLINDESSLPFITVTYFIDDCVLQNTATSSFITIKDCILLQATDVGILGIFTIVSIIPSCSFPFSSVIPTLFSFLLKLFTIIYCTYKHINSKLYCTIKCLMPGAHKRKERLTPMHAMEISKHKLRRVLRT